MPPNANTECDLGHEWLHEWMIGRRNYHRNLEFCQSDWYLNIKVLIHFRREMLYGHYCQVYDYDVLIVSKTHIQKHKCPFLQDNKDFYVLHISFNTLWIKIDTMISRGNDTKAVRPHFQSAKWQRSVKKNMKEDAVIWSWKCCQRGGNTCKDQRNDEKTILQQQQLAQAQRP